MYGENIIEVLEKLVSSYDESFSESITRSITGHPQTLSLAI
jgi:hypothetical protein